MVDAGISPQEVCIEDHIALGGSPTVPEALSGEVASLVWSVVTPGVSVEFYPNAFDDNPQVYIDQITTFQVTMTLSDGSTCSSEVTLMPIAQPTLDLPETLVQCDDNLNIQFVNSTPSNSVFINYDVNWGTTRKKPWIGQKALPMRMNNLVLTKSMSQLTWDFAATQPRLTSLWGRRRRPPTC